MQGFIDVVRTMNNYYFEDEVRSGFYVPGMVKRAWAAQLDVLAEVDRICRKHDIQYFAEWGTLLGAIRHKGFIPWDDDLDICMKRQDYNKFLQVAPQEMHDGYSLGNIYTDLDYTDFITRIMNTRTIHLDDEFLQEFHQFPYMAGLDIFPLDYLSSNEEENAIQMQLLELVSSFAYAYESATVEWGAGAPYIEQIQQLCGVQLDRTKPIQQQLLILLDRLSALYNEKDADFITIMSLWKRRRTYKLPKYYYDEAVYLPFEETMIPVPRAYDSILHVKYGDYMRLLKNGSTHDYPYFKSQEKMLFDLTGIQYRRYVCPEEINNGRELVKQADGRQTIVFLPYQARKWNAIESIWEKVRANENVKVIVAPIPYFHRGFKGEQLDFCDERELFPKEVETVDYRLLDLEKLHPDAIYIQDCCDEYNRCISVHPDFYSSKIWKYTDQLIYIPWFLLDDFNESEGRSYANMENYCMMPGIVYADTVMVQSEQMRDMYIRRLTEWAGAQTQAIWEKKIVAAKLPIVDKLEKERQREIHVPEKWNNILYHANGRRKKIIVYGNNASGLVEHGTQMLEKLQSVFEEFANQKDEVVLIWRPDKYTAEFSKSVEQQLWRRYLQLQQKFRDAGWGIFLPEDFDEMTEDDLMVLADEYCGDSGQLALRFEQEGKPVRIQTYLPFDKVE